MARTFFSHWPDEHLEGSRTSQIFSSSVAFVVAMTTLRCSTTLRAALVGVASLVLFRHQPSPLMVGCHAAVLSASSEADLVQYLSQGGANDHDIIDLNADLTLSATVNITGFSSKGARYSCVLFAS